MKINCCNETKDEQFRQNYFKTISLIFCREMEKWTPEKCSTFFDLCFSQGDKSGADRLLQQLESMRNYAINELNGLNVDLEYEDE